MKTGKTSTDDRKKRKTLVNMTMESTPYYTHAIPTRNFFKKSAGQYIDSDDDDPFFLENEGTWWRGKIKERHQSHTEE